MPPGHFKYGWSAPIQRYAHNAAETREVAVTAAAAAARALEVQMIAETYTALSISCFQSGKPDSAACNYSNLAKTHNMAEDESIGIDWSATPEADYPFIPYCIPLGVSINESLLLKRHRSEIYDPLHTNSFRTMRG